MATRRHYALGERANFRLATAHGYSRQLRILCLVFAFFVLKPQCLGQGALGPLGVKRGNDPKESAQIEVDSGEPTDLHSLYYSAHLPTDRRLEQDLEQARRLFLEARYSEGLTLVDRVLAAPQDAFPLSDARQPGEVARGLKAAARDLLAELPPDGIAALELDLGAKGRRVLRRAIREGDLSAIAMVAARYPVTSAAGEATAYLAQAEIDLGHFETAARLYGNLLDSPTSSPEQRALALVRRLICLAAMRPSHAYDTAADNLIAVTDPTLLRQVRRLIGERDIIAWLATVEASQPLQASPKLRDGWLIDGGDVRRNPIADTSSPHSWPTWKSRTLHQSHDTRQIKGREDWQRANDTAWLPLASPLAVGDLVIARSPENLIAFDWQTGRRIWETRPVRPAGTDRPLTLAAKADRGNQAISLDTLEQRVWLDSIYGDASSDGERVFAVRNLYMPSGQIYSPWRIQGFGRRTRNVTELTNTLAAYDLRSEGKLVWESNGASKGELEGVFYLGAPIAIDGTLYVLGELRNAIQLLALDADSGRLLWKQWLVNLERSVQFDLGRRLAGASPTFGHGLLLCPTGAGSVVAVDPFDRSLVWCYRYEVDDSVASRDAVGWHQHIGAYATGLTDRWRRHRCIAVGDSVLITAPESTKLHCIDALDGTKRWSQPRQSHLFVAGVVGDRVVTVSPQHVDLVQLSNGKPVAKASRIRMPKGTAIVGLGVLAGDDLFLPVSQNRIATVDIRAGKLDELLSVQSVGSTGNLAYHRDTLISQSTTAVARFDQLESLKTNAKLNREEREASPDQLRIRGEIALSEGALDEAKRLFLKAYEAAPTDAAIRSRLGYALLESLRQNYAKNKHHLGLLGELLEATPEQIDLWRLHVDSSIGIEDYAEAFESLLKLYAVVQQTTITLEGGSGVSANRWFVARLISVWEGAGEDLRSQMSLQIQELREGHVSPQKPGSLSRFSRYFGAIPAGREPRLAHATQLLESGRHAEAELAMQQTDATERRDQIAELAKPHRHHFAHLAHPPTTNAGQDSLEWPDGRVQADTTVGRSPSGASGTLKPAANPRTILQRAIKPTHLGVPWLGPADLSLLESGNQILGWNHWGEIVQEINLGFEVGRAELRADSVKSIRFGRFCVIGAGRNVAVIDLLGGTADTPEPLLWASSPTRPNYLTQRQINQRRVNNRTNAWLGSQNRETHLGQLCAAGPYGVALQTDDRIRCFDLASGELVWERTNLPVGGLRFGDDRHLFVVNSNQSSCTVLSMIDGREIKTCQPPEGKVLAIAGGNVATSQYRSGQRILKIVDLLAEEELLRRSYEAGVKFSKVESGKFGCMTLEGQFEWIDLISGKLIFEQQLAAEKRLQDLHVRYSGNRLFIVTNRRTKAQHATAGHEAGSDMPVVTGRVYALHPRTGAPLWDRPATIEGQGLGVLQPEASPALFFVSRLIDRKSNRKSETTKLLCLDKRTGRSLYRDDSLRSIGNGGWSVRVDGGGEPRFTVLMPQSTVSLRFTDAPRPPEPVALAEVEGRGKNVSSGLWGIGKRWLGLGRDSSSNQQEPDDD